MLFCFTIHCLYMFGHGCHSGQVTFISILMNKPYKIEFKQPSDFCKKMFRNMCGSPKWFALDERSNIDAYIKPVSH